MAKPTQEKKRSRAPAGGGDRKAVTSRKKQKPAAVVATPHKQTKKPQEVVEESENDDEDNAVEEEEVDEESDNDDGATTATADSDGGADEESGEEDENGAGSDDEEDEETMESDSPVEEEPKKKAKAKPRAKAAAVKKPAAKSAKTANGRTTKKPAAKAKAPAKSAKKAVPAKKAPVKKAAAAKPKPKPVVKKRKVRSQEDKILENEPMNKPFYVETGSEWHATDIDFDELSALRSMWELPSACHILWLLQNPLTLRFSHKLLDFEAALLNPASSTILEDVFTKLLLKKSERDCLTAGIGLKYEWWNKQLREYYMVMYDKWYALLRKAGEKVPESFSDDEDDEDDDQQIDVELSDDEWMALDILKARLETLGMVCPLKHKSFAELPADLRCKILHNLCEAVIDDPTNTEHVRMMEEDDMRVEPLGRDRAGNFYYFFPQFYEERRLYRLELATKEWGLWAKGADCFRALLVAMKEIRGRKVAGEQELIDHLEVIVEQIEEEALEREKEMEKANKRAILEAIPRKRSVRIQVKQIEQMEQQKQEVENKQQLSMEELADLKRAELLRKVEMEAEREARELEKEAKRVEQELKERETAAAERELRRQRRLEKEKEEETEQRRLEAERQKEKEARELRAKLRKAAEKEARLQDQIEQTDDEAPKSSE